MFTKAVLVFCAQAFVIQSALSQCTSRAAVTATPGIATPVYPAPYGFSSPGLAYDGLTGWSGKSLACDGLYPVAAPAVDFTPTSGGALSVASASAVAPVGLAVTSENVYEGILASTGELPFISTISVESVLPTAGVGAIDHSCGDGVNAMISDKIAFAPDYIGTVYPPAVTMACAAAISPGFAAPGLAYHADWARKGYGCAL